MDHKYNYTDMPNKTTVEFTKKSTYSRATPSVYNEMDSTSTFQSQTSASAGTNKPTNTDSDEEDSATSRCCPGIVRQYQHFNGQEFNTTLNHLTSQQKKVDENVNALYLLLTQSLNLSQAQSTPTTEVHQTGCCRP